MPKTLATRGLIIGNTKLRGLAAEDGTKGTAARAIAGKAVCARHSSQTATAKISSLALRAALDELKSFVFSTVRISCNIYSDTSVS